MKKIIITAVLFVFSSMSANALDMDTFKSFSITGGLGQNTSVWGASADEKNYAENNTTLVSTNSTQGVFTDHFSDMFAEIGIGQYISLGMSHTPDAITTPTNIANEGQTDEQTVSVSFNDLNTAYVKLNIPGGLYVKFGSAEVDVDIKTSRSTYTDVNGVKGTTMGIGYEKKIVAGLGLRVEGAYMEFDGIKSSDGDATDNITNNGLNEVTADNLEGLTAKIAVTYTFGGNSN